MVFGFVSFKIQHLGHLRDERDEAVLPDGHA